MSKKLAELLTDKAIETDTKTLPKKDKLKKEAEKEDNLMGTYNPKIILSTLNLKGLKLNKQTKILKEHFAKKMLKKLLFFLQGGQFS